MRIGLVGCGHMGRLHAEKLAGLVAEEPDVRFVGAADIRPERARELAGGFGIPHHADCAGLVPDCDAVIVAVPTVAHHAVVRASLEAGCDVLVEKPIAASVAEAQSLLALAAERDRVLQVGHLEWFNPAMRVIRDCIRRPRFVEAHRMGPFPARATDIDVVRDLMIHDLDILQQLLGEEPERVEAIGVPVLTPNVDIANARVTWASGCVANLTASRVSPTPMRKLRFFQRDGYFSIDFLEQKAVIFRRELDGDDGEPQIRMETIEGDRGDALSAQLRAFTEAVRTRKPPSAFAPGAGDDAVGALRTALRVVDAMPSLDELE